VEKIEIGEQLLPVNLCTHSLIFGHLAIRRQEQKRQRIFLILSFVALRIYPPN
jgi:hypothetical protein